MTHENIQPKNIPIEITPQKEVQFCLKQTITISGTAGTGKSLIVGTLAFAYNLPQSQIIKVGEILREQVRKETGKELAGFYKRPVEQDEEFDVMQLMLLNDPSPKIIDSRLGGWLAKKNKNLQTENTTPITSILLTGDKETLRKRTYNRNKKLSPELIYETSIGQEDDREKKDLEQWINAHPELNGINPLIADNKHIYDFHLDVTDLSKDEMIQAVHDFLVDVNAVEKI